MTDNPNPKTAPTSKAEIGSLSGISGGEASIAGRDVVHYHGTPQQPVNAPQDIFSTYKNRIFELLRSKGSNLSEVPVDDPIIREIRLLTLTALRELEPERRGILIHFLIDAEFIHQISLHRADLRKADLSMADLDNIDLSRANLCGAYLQKANLIWANLSEADLRGVNLYGANLYKASLYGVDLSGANLSGADLTRANLYKSIIDTFTQMDNEWRLVWQIVNQGAVGMDLSDKDLSGANLSKANLSRANLSGADLSGADLSDTDLSDADLRGVNLNEANLSGAKLSNIISLVFSHSANLRGTNLSGVRLIDARPSGATIPDGTKYD